MKVLHLEKNKIHVIEECVTVLSHGGLVIGPTDTVYGAFVNARSEQAVSKLIQFKSRSKGKPISVFVRNLSEAEKYVKITYDQKKILSYLLPGRYTIVLPSRKKLSKLLESEHETLGIRVIDNYFINKLLRAFKTPITATSANISGQSPHYSVQSFLRSLPTYKKKLIDLVIDGGKLRRNRPSTVLDYTQEDVSVLRQGSGDRGNVQTYISHSVENTIKVGEQFAKKINTEQKPVVLLLQGELGVGKTVFTKGIGKFFGLVDITSPSYTICEEYEVKRNGINKFVHIDLYNVFKKEEFKYIKLENYLQKRNVLCIEWGEKTGDIINILKKKSNIVHIQFSYISMHERLIVIKAEK